MCNSPWTRAHLGFSDRPFPQAHSIFRVAVGVSGCARGDILALQQVADKCLAASAEELRLGGRLGLDRSVFFNLG
jgi:hypothetical protein